ncbi:MAG: helix-turn-helix transcriptional regulator [Nitrospinae bacterium]|nr:helix-turn-helix transcriptional regulator [Nitrospinota bacterium]
MNIAVSELMKKQTQFKKITLKAVNVIFESNFSKNAIRRVEKLDRKFNPGMSFQHEKKISILTKEDPKRIIAWAIAQRIKEARERQGLKQEDLAKKTGIARPNFVRIEQGRHIPTLTTLKKIADALGLDINSLMAQPAVTEEDRLEFKEMAEAGVDEWARQLKDEDDKD